MNELNIQNGEYYGAEKQMVVMIEELSELIQAASKWLRIQQNGLVVRKSPEEVMENLIEELADVSITTDQIKHLLGIPEKRIREIRTEKIRRTAESIEKERRHDHEQNHKGDPSGELRGRTSEGERTEPLDSGNTRRP